MTGTGPRTAPAAEKPCQLYAHGTAPRPTRTQGHHRHPEYLQKRVYGRTRDTELLYLCGLCHDNCHEAISWLLGEGRKPDPMPGQKTLREAHRTVAWYQAEVARAAAKGHVVAVAEWVDERESTASVD